MSRSLRSGRRGLALALAIALPTSAARARAESDEGACTPIPVFANGGIAGSTCAELPGRSQVVLDLGDDWTPLVFSETPDRPQPYRMTFLDLANERVGPGSRFRTARRDRYYELFGIFPTFGVIRARLLDVVRHTCHAAIDDGPLRSLRGTLAPWDAPPVSAARAATRSAALAVVQDHLSCEGFLSPGAKRGTFDGPTSEALALYQRRNMIPSLAIVDRETREAILTPSAELDFRTLLRVLRERVVDATGLIEDGSASAAWEPILGRFIDSPEYRPPLRPLPVPGAAPDLVDRATETAAIALGWSSPAAAVVALQSRVPGRVAVRMPGLPAYVGQALELRAEIDRGDVWTAYPLDAEGGRRRSPAKNRPTFTLFARTPDGEIALVRWPTTIGAWKEEKVDDAAVALRYKASPVGRAYWRDLVAAPAWFPPPTTPDRELVRRRAEGGWVPDEDAVGPGYRSAYGLVALLHFRALEGGDAAEELSDTAIRTHGSGNYRSIMRGSSHGCHRLFNHLAIRLGSYLLAHHGHEREGVIAESYARTLHWNGQTLKLRVSGRGYRYQLGAPIPVDVLPGRRVGTHPRPAVPPKDSTVPPTAPQARSGCAEIGLPRGSCAASPNTLSAHVRGAYDLHASD